VVCWRHHRPVAGVRPRSNVDSFHNTGAGRCDDSTSHAPRQAVQESRERNGPTWACHGNNNMTGTLRSEAHVRDALAYHSTGDSVFRAPTHQRPQVASMDVMGQRSPETCSAANKTCTARMPPRDQNVYGKDATSPITAPQSCTHHLTTASTLVARADTTTCIRISDTGTAVSDCKLYFCAPRQQPRGPART